MKLLVDMLNLIDCIEMDLHTHNNDPEETDFGHMMLETLKPLDLVIGESIFFKEVDFVLDEIESIESQRRCNKGSVNAYFRYRFDVAAPERRREKERLNREKRYIETGTD